MIKVPDYDGIGIYRIYNPVNGKSYIGSSENIKKRIYQHLRAFKTGKCNLKFKDDIEDFPLFELEILEKIPYGSNLFYILSKESYYINLFDSYKNGYNNAHTTVVPTKETLVKTLDRCTSPKSKQYTIRIINKLDKPIYGKHIDKSGKRIGRYSGMI